MDKRVEFINGEIPISDTSIQHIQSFLLSKQAAQTTVLSKSWYRAWLTRPDLDFRSSDFPTLQEFWEFAEKTIQRYDQSNLKINSFNLQADTHIDLKERSSLADRLVVSAMRMDPFVFTFELNSQVVSRYNLPHQVLASKALTRLSLKCCSIGRQFGGEVRCPKLKYLSLCTVIIECDMFLELISGAPLIEEMVLSQCRCYIDAKRDYPKLSPYIKSRQDNNVPVSSLLNLCEFNKLRCLVLERIFLKGSFFDNFSTNFPCLKDFDAQSCHFEEAIQICSPSVERVTFAMWEGLLRAKFEFPSLLKFTFSGNRLPSISFEKASREWEADISIRCRRHPYNSWFINLNRLLTKLSLAKISLSLDFVCNKVENEHRGGNTGNTRSLPKPVVLENLMVCEGSLLCNVFLDCLFSYFRPKFINHYWLPESCSGWNLNNNVIKTLCEKLVVRGVSESCPLPNLNLSSLSGLVDVNAERTEGDTAEWQPMPLSALLDSSTIPPRKQMIRFHLKWE